MATKHPTPDATEAPDNGHEIITVDMEPAASDVLMPIVSIDAMLARYNAIGAIKDRIMRPKIHYGVIPGTGDKPTLLKPGAEALCTAFGLTPNFEPLDASDIYVALTGQGGESDTPLIAYRYRCTLTTRDGRFVVGQGIGSCNTHEAKYRYRTIELECPECGLPYVLKSKDKDKPGYFCWKKKGGCGFTFAADDDRLTSQTTGRGANPDIADQINTIDKMAQKRALVAAVLVAVGASDFFTQDIEDMAQFTRHWTLDQDMEKFWTFTASLGLERTEVWIALEIKSRLTEFHGEKPEALGRLKAYAAAKAAYAGSSEPLQSDIEDEISRYSGEPSLDSGYKD